MRSAIPGFVLTLALAGGAVAQAPVGADAALATVTKFTAAVNRGDTPGALAYLGPSPTMVEDLAPYRWQGPGAGEAWLAAMGANAQAKGMTVINMRLLPASRIEVEGGSAYVVVPGLLTYAFKDGRTAHADGVLTFALQQAGGAWKIDAVTWTGPRAKP